MIERIRSALAHFCREVLYGAILLASVSSTTFAGILDAQTVAANPNHATSSIPSVDDIERLIDRGHAAEALAKLDEKAKQTPSAPGVQRLRGLALYSENKLPEAEKAFAAAMVADVTDTTASHMRGITLFRLGRPKDAIPFLESGSSNSAVAGNTVVKHASAPVDPQYVLALCYVDTRRYEDARHAFAKQYSFAEDSAPAYLLTARMLLRREFIPVAQEFARRALELEPRLPLAHRLLGETELADNHLSEAIAEFEQEKDLNPLDPTTYDRLGDAYVRQGDFDRARTSLQEAVLLEPNSTGPFILLGKVLLKQQDAAGASGYLEHARDMDPQNYMTHSLLGQAYRQMGRVDDARAENATAEKLQNATVPNLSDAK